MKNSSDTVRAGRAALLDLLADLLLHELDAPTAALLAGDPALATALDPPRSEAALHELRAVYARLLLIELPPYGSVFLDAPPVIGGEASLAWERFLAEHNHALSSLERAAAADHAGLYLRALAAAERDGSPEWTALVLREALRWLPQALTAIARNDEEGFYAHVADLAAHALQACAGATCSQLDTGVGDAVLEPEDESLRAIASWLSTPAWSGWFLSKQKMRQFARPFGAAIGIVDRTRMLEHVFEASALDHRTGELLDALLEEWHIWRAALVKWHSELGTWATALDSWDAHLQRTHAALCHMRASLLASP